MGKMDISTCSLPNRWAERAILSTLTGERKRQSRSPRTGGLGTEGGVKEGLGCRVGSNSLQVGRWERRGGDLAGPTGEVLSDGPEEDEDPQGGAA